MHKVILIFIISFSYHQLLISQNVNAGTKSNVNISGTIQLSLLAYETNRDKPIYSPFSYTLTAKPVLRLHGIKIPISLIYSERDRSFRQPFNRYGLSPTYKSLKLHLGYRSLFFNRYSLAGHQFFGAGIEFNPGKFQLGFVKGRFNKSTVNVLGIDSYIDPSFDRSGYAFNIGYGGDKSFVGLSLLKAKDDFGTAVDTLNISDIKPEENLVVALKANAGISQHINIKVNSALSAFTRNVLTSELEDDFPFKEFVSQFITPRLSSSLKSAVDITLNFKIAKANLSLGYKRIDPDFKSMGAYRFLTDIEDKTVSASFPLFNSKLNFSGSFGVQRNNLDNHRLQNTNRQIGGVNLTFLGGQFLSGNISYNNYKSDVLKADEVELSDSFNIIQVSENFSGNLNFQLSSNNPSQIIVSLFRQKYSDESNMNMMEANSSTGGILGYSYTVSKAKLGLSTGLNYNSIESMDFESRQWGLRLGVTKRFQKAASFSLNFNANRKIFNGEDAGHSLIGRLRFRYKISKMIKSNLSLAYLSNTLKNNAKERNNTDLKGRINLIISL